jgi:phospholipid/cholesterol/gamma-HCH transport system substrate-binding protein
MNGRSQKIRLGIFIMVSGALLLLIVGWFTTRGLFDPKDTYYIAYSNISVTGLEVGSPVKYLGINVGTVRDIRIHPRDFNTVVFEISVETGTPIKEDAVADIAAVGITGMKAIEIRGGTPEAGFLAPESYIEPGSTMAVDISGRAEVMALKLEEILNNLMGFTQPANLENFTRAAGDISVLAKNSNSTILNFDEMLAENRESFREAVTAISSISVTVNNAATDLASSMERFNEIMQGEDISEVLGNLREISLTIRESNLRQLIENIAATAGYTQNLLADMEIDFESSSSRLNTNLDLLQYTLEHLNDATRKISTDPSVLIRGQNHRNAPDRNLRGN